MGMRIVSIVGARPQFIKCAPLSKALREKHDEILVHTGQHYDYEMSKIFFDELDIPEPDYNLNIGSSSHGAQTGGILIAVERVLMKEEPNLVLVFGDTNSTLAGALAAAKLRIPVAHVEAGLRSYDRSMPEEINRILTDHISKLLFTPTRNANKNLRKENITKGVFFTGDIMVDTYLGVRTKIGNSTNLLSQYNLIKGEYCVTTIHRAANTDEPINLKRIIKAFGKISSPIAFPIHPRTKKMLNAYGLTRKLPSNIILMEPLGYLNMLRLMSNARSIITDSGGIQKEAFFLGVRCITLRNNTEWTETLRDGRNCLVGLDETKILEALCLPKLSSKPTIYPFGKGGVSKRIANIIDNRLYCAENLKEE